MTGNDDVMTEPMTKAELCAAFQVNRNRFAEVMEAVPGIVPFLGRYRVPLSAMPSPWLLAKGYLRPGIVEGRKVMPVLARPSGTSITTPGGGGMKETCDRF